MMIRKNPSMRKRRNAVENNFLFNKFNKFSFLNMLYFNPSNLSFLV